MVLTGHSSPGPSPAPFPPVSTGRSAAGPGGSAAATSAPAGAGACTGALASRAVVTGDLSTPFLPRSHSYMNYRPIVKKTCVMALGGCKSLNGSPFLQKKWMPLCLAFPSPSRSHLVSPKSLCPFVPSSLRVSCSPAELNRSRHSVFSCSRLRHSPAWNALSFHLASRPSARPTGLQTEPDADAASSGSPLWFLAPIAMGEASLP